MEKLPIEIFIDQQLKRSRYKSIIAQLGVDPVAVQFALVAYLREQGVHMVTPTLGEELAERMAFELETRHGVSGVARSIIEGAPRISTKK